MGFTALLVSIISGLEISWGTTSRDIISPSPNCKGQGRPPNLPVEISSKTSLAALDTGSRLRLQTGSTYVQRQLCPLCRWKQSNHRWTEACLSSGRQARSEAVLSSRARHRSPGQARPEASTGVRPRLRLGLQRSSCSSPLPQIPLKHIYTDQQIIFPVTNLPLSLMCFTSCLVINPGVIQTTRLILAI